MDGVHKDFVGRLVEDPSIVEEVGRSNLASSCFLHKKSFKWEGMLSWACLGRPAHLTYPLLLLIYVGSCRLGLRPKGRPTLVVFI